MAERPPRWERDGTARDPQRRRRPERLPCHRQGPAPTLRGQVPDHPGPVQRRGTGGARGDEAARRRRRGPARRLPDARDERHRTPGAGPRPVSGGEAGTAHRLRRHRRRDRRDQHRRPRPLHAQAVGSTRGEALSGGRRPARSLDHRRTPAGHRDPGGQAPVVGAGSPRRSAAGSSNRSRRGTSTTGPSRCTTARNWPRRGTIRPTNRCRVRPGVCPRTGGTTSTDRRPNRRRSGASARSSTTTRTRFAPAGPTGARERRRPRARRAR